MTSRSEELEFADRKENERDIRGNGDGGREMENGDGGLKGNGDGGNETGVNMGEIGESGGRGGGGGAGWRSSNSGRFLK